MIPKELKQNIKSHCLKVFDDDSISDLQEIMGGADTRIFFFDLKNSGISLALRVFRDKTTERAEYEYNVHKYLTENGVNAPKPFFFDTTLDHWNYLCMEKIDGSLHAQYFQESLDQRSTVLRDFYSVLHNLQSINVEQLTIFDISPTKGQVDNFIQYTKNMVESKGLDELKPIIDYIEKIKFDLNYDPQVLVHGDFHSNNMIVNPDGKYTLLDWSNVYVGDYRIDLAFSIMTFNALFGTHTEEILAIYEELTQRKVENIDFFIVMSTFHNLMRIYSCVNDYSITGENETTCRVFLEMFIPYSRYVVKKFQEICQCEFPSLAKALDLK